MVGRSDSIGEALSGVVSIAVRRRSRELSLTSTSTLATLERTGPRRLTELAANEEVTQPSMTALVTQLEDLGLARRQRDETDARVVLVAITPAGRERLREIRRSSAMTFSQLIDKLEEPDVTALAAAMPALRHLVTLAAESQDAAPRVPEAGSSRGGGR